MAYVFKMSNHTLKDPKNGKEGTVPKKLPVREQSPTYQQNTSERKVSYWEIQRLRGVFYEKHSLTTYQAATRQAQDFGIKYIKHSDGYSASLSNRPLTPRHLGWSNNPSLSPQEIMYQQFLEDLRNGRVPWESRNPAKSVEERLNSYKELRKRMTGDEIEKEARKKLNIDRSISSARQIYERSLKDRKQQKSMLEKYYIRQAFDSSRENSESKRKNAANKGLLLHQKAAESQEKVNTTRKDIIFAQKAAERTA